MTVRTDPGYMRTLASEPGNSGTDKQLLPIEYCGIQIIIPAWDTCFWRQSRRITRWKERLSVIPHEISHTLLLLCVVSDTKILGGHCFLSANDNSFFVGASKIWKIEKELHSWWRHQNGNISALLALYAGNPPPPPSPPPPPPPPPPPHTHTHTHTHIHTHTHTNRRFDSDAKLLMFSLIHPWTNDWVKNRHAGASVYVVVIGSVNALLPVRCQATAGSNGDLLSCLNKNTISLIFKLFWKMSNFLPTYLTKM